MPRVTREIEKYVVQRDAVNQADQFRAQCAGERRVRAMDEGDHKSDGGGR